MDWKNISKRTALIYYVGLQQLEFEMIARDDLAVSLQQLQYLRISSAKFETKDTSGIIIV